LAGLWQTERSCVGTGCCQAELGRGVVSLDPWAWSVALANVPWATRCSCREHLQGLQEGNASLQSRCLSLRCWGGVGGTGTGVPCWAGGCARPRLGSQRGVGARQQEGFVCASSWCHQADVDSLGFLSSAQIGASLSSECPHTAVCGCSSGDASPRCERSWTCGE